ncbi:MAG TPA: choice-of-anchor tandem repeat GloVer-containing protein [Terriglobales bacterium]|nr:choice-of-anchor tandem repeat GloVer-containing protein [Terriglobales bacterium]
MKFRLLLIFALTMINALATAGHGQSFQVLHDFGAGEDGTVPYGVAAARSGEVFGVTGGGGANGSGTAFALSFVNGAWQEAVIHSFSFFVDGSPDSGVALDAYGNIYGTAAGGPQGKAVVYELSRGDGWASNILYDSGAGPGVTINGGSSVFGAIGPGDHLAGAIAELSPSQNGWIYSPLYSFCSLPKCVDGYDVKWPLTLDAKGDIYGATYFGGNGYGLAFELSHNLASSSASGSWTYHIMHAFGSFPTDGGYPGSGLVLDKLGNAYGVSYNGGANGDGAVYKLTPITAAPGAWAETQIYNFPSDLQTGGFPVGNLVFDQAGNLYGSAGGGTGCNAFGCGVIFKLTPQKNGQWSYSVVHYFNGQDGFGPNPLAIDQNGNLFGTTQSGGTYNLGVAFEITP